MKQHNFCIEHAEKYGIKEAIIINNLTFWLDKAKANNSHLHEDKYWIYNSVRAWHELFPYMSEKVIRTTLVSLEKQNVIITGNFNQHAYDRTRWFTFNPLYSTEYSICPDGQQLIDEMANADAGKGEPIPDNKPDSNPDNKPATNSEQQTRAKKIPTDWKPSDHCLSLLETRNIPRKYALNLIPEFIMYWSGEETKRKSWDSTFVNHCKSQAQRNPPPKIVEIPKPTRKIPLSEHRRNLAC